MSDSLEDPSVAAARVAGDALWKQCGLEMRERYVVEGEYRLRVRVFECGTPSGPPLVFVEGGLGEAIGWAVLLPHLGDFRCITLDRPGGGLSDPVDFRKVDVRRLASSVLGTVLDATGVERASFVANSMGAWWSIQFATHNPTRVDKLALLGCPALLLDSAAPLPMRLVGVPGLGRVMARMMRPPSLEKVRELPTFLGHPREVGDRWSDVEVEAFYRYATLPDAPQSWYSLLRRFLRPWGANPRMRIPEEQLRSLPHETLLLWGSDDPFGGVEVGRRAVSIMPHARLEEVGRGHLPWWDEPLECARRVREFVRPQG